MESCAVVKDGKEADKGGFEMLIQAAERQELLREIDALPDDSVAVAL